MTGHDLAEPSLCDSDVPRHRPADAKSRHAGRFQPAGQQQCVIAVCHSDAPSSLDVSSAQPGLCAPVSPTKIFVRRSCVAYLLQKFPRFSRFPKLHSGPPAQRRIHYQNDACVQWHGNAPDRRPRQSASATPPQSVRSSRSSPLKRKQEVERSSCCNPRTMP